MNKYSILVALIFLTLVFVSCEDEEDFSKKLYLGGKVSVYYTFSDSAGTDFYEKKEEQYGMPIRFQMFENGTYSKDVIADSWGYILNVGVSEGKEYQLKLIIEDEVLFESKIYTPKISESKYAEEGSTKVDFLPRSGLRIGNHFELKDFDMRIENNPDRLFVRPNPFVSKTILDIMLTSSNTFSVDVYNLFGDKYEVFDSDILEPYIKLPVDVNSAQLNADSLPQGNYIFRMKSGNETFYQMAVRDSSGYTTLDSIPRN